MKKILFLLALAPTGVMAQAPSQKQVDVSVVEKLAGSKASLKEARSALGQATTETISPDKAYLEYNTGMARWTLFFGKEQKLEEVSYSSVQQYAHMMNYKDLKSGGGMKNRSQVSDKLGMPTRIRINGNREEWFYLIKNDKEEQSVMVEFDLASNADVKRFLFNGKHYAPVIIAPEQTEALKKGISTADEIQRRLGAPSRIMVDGEKELWEYTSDNTSLTVHFDKKSTLSDFTYRRRAQ